MCSYSRLPFFLSRGEDARASASCPSSTGSESSVVEVGIPISGLKFLEAVGDLLSIVLLGMTAGVGLIH